MILRRVITAAAVLLLAVAPAAQGQERDYWAGSSFTSATSSSSGSTPVTAVFVRAYPANTSLLQWQVVADLTVVAPSGQPAGCTTSIAGGEPTSLVRGEGDRHTKAGTLSTSCNGTYSLSSKAELQRRRCFLGACSGWELENGKTITQTVVVAAPPPDVNATTAAGDGRAVVVSWTAPTSLPPDFLGYRVQMLGADGWATLADLDADASTYTHDEPPAAGGPVEYRVLARRSAPGGEVTSTGGSTSTAEVTPSPTTSTPGNPGGPGDPGTPTTGGGGVDLGDLGTPTVPGSRPGGGGGRVTAPRLGITGTFLPPLLKPTTATVNPSTATTLDTGFEGTLPYDSEPGDDDPVLPDDELAGFFQGENASRGMVIPVATALVLALWAFHLRYLARVSRPVDDLY